MLLQKIFDPNVRRVRSSHFNSVDALKNGTEGNGFNSLTMSKKLHTHQ
jgi:hypothetical protein